MNNTTQNQPTGQTNTDRLKVQLTAAIVETYIEHVAYLENQIATLKAELAARPAS